MANEDTAKVQSRFEANMDNDSEHDSNSENENDDDEDMSPDFRSKTHLVSLYTRNLIIFREWSNRI